MVQLLGNLDIQTRVRILEDNIRLGSPQLLDGLVEPLRAARACGFVNVGPFLGRGPGGV
jgi:hypothetical protein